MINPGIVCVLLPCEERSDKPWDYEYLFQKNIYPGLGKERALVNKWLEFFP